MQVPSERKLAIELIKAPEEPSQLTRILTFLRIEDLSDETFEPEEAAEIAEGEALDSLIGLDECPEGEKVRYIVHTETREMIFLTKDEPLIEEVRLKVI